MKSQAELGAPPAAQGTSAAPYPQSQPQEFTLKTGRKVTLQELTGGQQMVIDDMVGYEKVVGIPTTRMLSSIRALDGQPVQFPKVVRELRALADRLRAREMNELMSIYRKNFDFMDTEDDLSKD
jgi:hypothetical protein